MLNLLRNRTASGPLWIIMLIAMFAAFDLFRSCFNLNLGRFPMFLKTLYIRVMLFEYMAFGTPVHARQSWNRQQRRAYWFNLSQRVRLKLASIEVSMRGLPAVAGGVTIRGSRSGLFWNHIPGGLPVITDAKQYSGNVFFVDSNTAQGGTTAGFGLHPDKAFTDIEAAIDSPVYATQGDVVFVLPGHAETVSDEITVDVAGVSIVGLGHGTARPQITQAFGGDAFALDAANIVLSGMYFNEATTAPGAGGAAIDMNAVSCKVDNCHFDLGADDLEAITITATGDGAEVSNCTFLVTANGPDAGIEIEAVVTEVYIHDCRFLGGNDTNAWDVGGINSGSAHTQCQITRNDFTFGPAIIFTAAATGKISFNLFSEGTLGSMLDPGSCMCHENYEADAVDQSARLIPTTVAS